MPSVSRLSHHSRASARSKRIASPVIALVFALVLFLPSEVCAQPSATRSENAETSTVPFIKNPNYAQRMAAYEAMIHRVAPAMVLDIPTTVPDQRKAALIASALTPRELTTIQAIPQTTAAHEQRVRLYQAADFDQRLTDSLARRRDFLAAVPDAIRRSGDDAAVIVYATDLLAFRIMQAVGTNKYKSRGLSAHKAREVMGDLIELDRFAELADACIQGDTEATWNVLFTLGFLSEANPEKFSDLFKRYSDFRNGRFERAKKHNAAGEYSDAVREARKVLNVINGENQHTMQYLIVRGLWKQRKYYEALYEARQGAYYFPTRHTFNYLFALIAMDANVCLNEAYERALIAQSQDPTNAGLNDAVADLKKKLGK